MTHGDWGLGIGDWGLGIGPNPQSPIPNPQSPIPNPHVSFLVIQKQSFFKKLFNLVNYIREILKKFNFINPYFILKFQYF
jgi:hypothetical protein